MAWVFESSSSSSSSSSLSFTVVAEVVASLEAGDVMVLVCVAGLLASWVTAPLSVAGAFVDGLVDESLLSLGILELGTSDWLSRDF